MLAMPERTAAIQNIHKTACFTFIEMLLGCAVWRGSEYAAPGQVRTPPAAAGRRVEGRLRPHVTAHVAPGGTHRCRDGLKMENAIARVCKLESMVCTA